MVAVISSDAATIIWMFAVVCSVAAATLFILVPISSAAAATLVDFSSVCSAFKEIFFETEESSVDEVFNLCVPDEMSESICFKFLFMVFNE